MSASKYRSPSTGEPCTASQYVAELICQRQSTKNKGGTLAYKFWNSPKWKKIYIGQVSEAAKLSKEFGDEVLVRFINSSKGLKMLSLRTKNIKQQLAAFKNDLTSEPKITVCVDELVDSKVYLSRKSFGNKTLVSRLREIDG